MKRGDRMTSRQAADFLGIKLETLYAYASRGLVTGTRAPGGGRGRHYTRADLEGLRARSEGPAASALRFGDPVLETRITRMTPEGPEYRGRPAVVLARQGVPFTAVAELLWTGSLPDARPHWPGDGPVLPVRELGRLVPVGSPPLAALALALPALAAADPLRFDGSPEAVRGRARRLIPKLAASFALALDPARLEPALETSDPVRALALALGVPLRKKSLALLELALVLCADHELNASTFAARVAASTGADLYACLTAGLAAFSGPRHGGASEQVEVLAREAGDPARAAATVRDRMRRGELLPGFGHPLYAQGDPRHPPLYEAALALAPRAPRVRTIAALVATMQEAGRAKPNVDTALAAACAALDLPIGMGAALFAIGRSAGWVAHVLEQSETPHVLRPRARFVDE
ncbi:MAG TPA: citrate/2-methylcitrate synthase [Myxococcota bacterium]|nr:citrate/2-methylcitrate synthase [Myxococcota bacterium]